MRKAVSLGSWGSRSSPREGQVPEIVLLNATDSPQFTNFSTGTEYLNPYVSADLDDDIIVVGELWGSSVRVPFDIRGYQLDGYCQFSSSQQEGWTCRETYMGRNKNPKRASIGEKAVLVDRGHDSIHLYCGLEQTCMKNEHHEGNPLPFHP